VSGGLQVTDRLAGHQGRTYWESRAGAVRGSRAPSWVPHDGPGQGCSNTTVGHRLCGAWVHGTQGNSKGMSCSLNAAPQRGEEGPAEALAALPPMAGPTAMQKQGWPLSQAAEALSRGKRIFEAAWCSGFAPGPLPAALQGRTPHATDILSSSA